MSEKIDAWFQHEGLDRTHMLLVMLEQSLGFYDPDCDLSDGEMHPSIWNERCKIALSAATSALADLYQAIGEWEEPAASMQDDSPRMMATHEFDEARIDRIASSHGDGEHYSEVSNVHAG